MTQREIKISKSILDTLHARDGKPMQEDDLFLAVHAVTECSHREFKAVLVICDLRGWLTGVEGKFSGKLWDINAEGEIARLQL
jgi:hypothetical protein